MGATRPTNVLDLKLKGLPPWLARPVRAALGSLTGFTALNRAYAALPPCEPSEFPQVVFDEVNIKVEAEGLYPSAIPAKGPVVVVANHPFGVIEGLAMRILLKRVRADAAMMLVHWLSGVPELRHESIFVARRDKTYRGGKSISGLRQAYSFLKDGGALAVFPAAMVEHFRWDKRRVAEADWSPHIATLIRRTRATTVPVHFRGHNSLRFFVLTAILPATAKLLLIREFLNKRNTRIVSVWGEPIPPEAWPDGMSDTDVIAQLQRRVEDLGRN